MLLATSLKADRRFLRKPGAASDPGDRKSKKDVVDMLEGVLSGRTLVFEAAAMVGGNLVIIDLQETGSAAKGGAVIEVQREDGGELSLVTVAPTNHMSHRYQ